MSENVQESTIINESAIIENGREVSIKNIEDALLGFIIMEPNPRMDDVHEILPTADYWNESVNRIIYQAFLDFYRAGEFPGDPALTIQELYEWTRHHNKSSSVFKTQEDVARLINGFIKDFSIFDPQEYKKYAEIIRWQKDRRQISELARSVLANSMSVPYNEREDYLSDVESKLGQITLSIRDNKGLLHISEATEKSWKTIEALKGGSSENPGIRTRISVLDKIIGGFNPGELITLAAQTGAGKTALSMAIAENVAQFEKRPVMIFSLEMMDEQLSDRMLAKYSRVSIDQFKKDFLKLNSGEYENVYGKEAANKLREKLVEQYHRLEIAKKFIDELPIYQTTTSNINVNTIKSMILQKQRELYQLDPTKPLGLVVIDYLQIIEPVDNSANRTRTEIVGQMSGKIKQIAKEAQVPILLLAQLNRQGEEDEAPTINHLRESAAIGHDSDKIIFMYSPNAKNTLEEFIPEYGESAIHKQMQERMKVKLVVAKNRQGQNNIEVDAIFDWAVQACFSQSEEKSYKGETFEEFFNKYYYKTRSGEDIFWPLKADEIPPELENYRSSDFVQLPYIDESSPTKRLVTEKEIKKDDFIIIASQAMTTEVKNNENAELDRIEEMEKQKIIDDLQVEMTEYDESDEDLDEKLEEDNMIGSESEYIDEDESEDDDDSIDLDELPEFDDSAFDELEELKAQFE